MSQEHLLNHDFREQEHLLNHDFRERSQSTSTFSSDNSRWSSDNSHASHLQYIVHEFHGYGDCENEHDYSSFVPHSLFSSNSNTEDSCSNASNTKEGPYLVASVQQSASSSSSVPCNWSVGSVGHAEGRCLPCAHFHNVKNPCTNGAECTFCHLCPPGELKVRQTKMKEEKALAKQREMERQKAIHGRRKHRRGNAGSSKSTPVAAGRLVASGATGASSSPPVAPLTRGKFTL